MGHFFRVKKTPQQTKKLTDSSGEGIREVQKERHTYHLPPAVPALSVSLTSIDAVTALCGRCKQKDLRHLIVSPFAWSEFFTACSLVLRLAAGLQPCTRVLHCCLRGWRVQRSRRPRPHRQHTCAFLLPILPRI